MRTNLCVAVIMAAVCLWAQPVLAVVVFTETFDDPGLPGTLNYSAGPGITWSNSGPGQLLADYGGNPPNANATVNAITNDGFIAPGGLRTIYSLDVGVPDGASAGSYNVGLVFGGYQAQFHPGYTPIPGAFRMEGGYSTGNQDMGFVPKLGVMHHIDVETLMIGTSLAVDVTITGLGTDDLLHTFNLSFLDTSPNLNAGQFGGRRSGGGNALSDAMFDNLQVQYVPEPSSALLLSLGTLGVFALMRRKRSGTAAPARPAFPSVLTGAGPSPAGRSVPRC